MWVAGIFVWPINLYDSMKDFCIWYIWCWNEQKSPHGIDRPKRQNAKVELVDGRQAYCHFGATWSVQSHGGQFFALQPSKGGSVIIHGKLRGPPPMPPPLRNKALIFGLIKGQWWLNVVNSLLIRPAISWGGWHWGGGPLRFSWIILVLVGNDLYIHQCTWTFGCSVGLLGWRILYFCFWELIYPDVHIIWWTPPPKNKHGT